MEQKGYVCSVHGLRLMTTSLAFSKATEFFKVGALPEFLGNWYSKVPTLKSHNPSTSDNHNKLASSAF